MMKYIYALLVGLFLLSGCGLKTDEKINAKEVNQAIKDRKIKRIYDSEVVAYAYEQGQMLSETWQKQLPAADSLCLMGNLLPLAQAGVLSGVYVRCPGTGDFYHEKEKEIWEAYQNAWKEGQLPEASVQRLGAKEEYRELLYAQPIQIKMDGKATWAMLSLILDKKQLIRMK